MVWRLVVPLGGRIDHFSILRGHFPQKPPQKGRGQGFPAAKINFERNGRNSVIYGPILMKFSETVENHAPFSKNEYRL